MTPLNNYLIKEAINASEHAYAPYSKMRVGAALWCHDGTHDLLFCGANIENSSLGLTACAERVAVFKAVFNGSHKHAMRFVIATNADTLPYPCGACRQVMSEFFSDDLEIVLASKKRIILQLTLKELIPYPFHIGKK